MELTHDLLDQQVLDRHGERMGKVDGVILELRHGRPPRVAAIEIGLLPAVRRLEIGWLTRWAARFPVTRIPIERVRGVDPDVTVDVDGQATNAFSVEHWLRDHVIVRIPGGR
jgi:sporulation protein YlmC with PRC-barrel domain